MTSLAPQGRYPSGMAPVTGTGVGVAMLLIKGLGLLGRSVNIASVSRPSRDWAAQPRDLGIAIRHSAAI